MLVLKISLQNVKTLGFSPIFLLKLLSVKKCKILHSVITKITCTIRKFAKNNIQKIKMVTMILSFLKVLSC